MNMFTVETVPGRANPLMLTNIDVRSSIVSMSMTMSVSMTVFMTMSMMITVTMTNMIERVNNVIVMMTMRISIMPKWSKLQCQIR